MKSNRKFFSLARLCAFAVILLLHSNLRGQQTDRARHMMFLYRADSLQTLGKLDASELAYRQALLFDKESIETFKGLGKIALARGNWPAFHGWFRKALAADPADDEAKDYLLNRSPVRRLVVSADSLSAAGSLNEAEASFKHALSLDGAFPDAFKGLGRLDYERGNWNGAIKWFDRALELDPGDTETRDFLIKSPQYRQFLQEGAAYLAQGKYDSARKRFKEALRMNPHAARAMKRMGRMAFDESNWGDVKHWYKKTLNEMPDDSESRYGLGIAYRETGKVKALTLKKLDFRKSEKYFRALVNSDSSYRDVFYQRAMLSKLREKWLAAVRWGRRQVALKPESEVANVGLHKLFRLFLIHENREKVDRWLALHDDDWSVYVGGERLRLRKDYAGADSVFVNLLAEPRRFSKIPVCLSYARSLLAQGRRREANDNFKLAIRFIQTDVDSEFLLDFSKYILTDGELAAYRKLQRPSREQDFFRAIWTARNPAPAARINDRVLEHLRRLNFADANYWFDGVRSWANDPDKSGYLAYPQAYALNEEFNDKGLIYIRHGEPDEVARTSSRTISNESWRYDPRPDRGKLIFHFVIEEHLATGNNWRLTPVIADKNILSDRVGWDPKLDRLYRALSQTTARPNLAEISSITAQISDESREVVKMAMSTDFHTVTKKQIPLEMPFLISSMRGFGNKTLLEVYFGIPLAALRNDNGSLVDFEHGAGVYSRNWKQIRRSFEKVHLAAADDGRVINNMFVQKYDFYLTPGDYNLAFYAKDEGESRTGNQRVRASVPSFSETGVMLSDPIPAYRISPVQDGSPFDKGEVAVVANPTREFKLDEPVFLYYEIYHLGRDEDGETRFKIENELKLTKSDKRGLKKVFGFLGGGDSKSIAIEAERAGKKTTAVEYTSFNVSKLEPGEYQLTIRVRDRLNNTAAEKSVFVRLLRE